ncbi:MAG: nitroreductase family protein [Gemmatimonadetes bacterium]|nr:nitroreductase family protein [Gemmatimonadota bacterium]
MSDAKRARPDHPIDDTIAARWSPYAYDGTAVPLADLQAVFEAARWAASAFNEQPWRYIVASRDDTPEFERLLSCLVDANQAWARHAGALALGVVGRRYSRNDKPNGTAEHDLGLASANLTLEATRRGFQVHQMAGILPERARELYGIPDGFDALTGIAVGRPAAPDDAPENFRDRDLSPRTRRPLAETVFTGAWGTAGLTG